jgi:hypothetical protein
LFLFLPFLSFLGFFELLFDQALLLLQLVFGLLLDELQVASMLGRDLSEIGLGLGGFYLLDQFVGGFDEVAAQLNV